ncbi:methyl-accepting chemotaxis protein, partial [Rhizobium ruizarguesonis]
AGQLMQNYTARLGDMKEVLQASGNIRQTQLNLLAPKISGEFKDLQAAVTGAQKNLDGSVDATVASATRTTLLISGLLIVIGLVLSYFVGRLISSAVRNMAQSMEQLARGEERIV